MTPSLTAVIRQKITSGVLPRMVPESFWIAPGNGRRCSGCGQPITSRDNEHEATVDERTVRLHPLCVDVWRAHAAWPLDATGDRLRGIVRAKLAAGALPREAPVRVWRGYGSGARCDACDERITIRDVEREADMRGERAVRFHEECYEAWTWEAGVPTG